MINFNKENIEILKICQTCRAFKYDGGWHFEEPPYLKERDPEEKVYVQFKSCPVCRIKELVSQCKEKLSIKK